MKTSLVYLLTVALSQALENEYVSPTLLCYVQAARWAPYELASERPGSCVRCAIQRTTSPYGTCVTSQLAQTK